MPRIWIGGQFEFKTPTFFLVDSRGNEGRKDFGGKKLWSAPARVSRVAQASAMQRLIFVQPEEK